MRKIMDTMHDEDIYGSFWAETFISIILARIFTLSDIFVDVKQLVLVPIIWIIIHLLFGKLIKKYSQKNG